MAVAWRWTLVALAVLGLSAAVMMAVDPTPVAAGNKPLINTIGSPGVAIKGYDPVAHFEQGGPRKGKSEHSLKHKGVTWRFASAENKAKFEANPAKYTPVYGGYCAYGVSQGYLVKIEGNAWAIRGGKLYLNYNRGIQHKWSRRPQSYIKRANARWPKLIAKR